MRCWKVGWIIALLLPVCIAGPAGAQPLDLILPTENDALLRGNGPAFYQYTERYFEGRHWHPWQGGTYGFVRNPRRTEAGLIYTRLHEGVDIKPLRRNAQGEPLDPVRAIDDGRVVYVNDRPGHSSYGIYVVIEHHWSGAPFYSLYAHLGRTDVETGDRVVQGERIGQIGYTGAGIDRERAHLHFEIGLLLNRHFEAWFDRHYPSGINRHGIFMGWNLRGLDVAELYRALGERPDLTIRAFLAAQAPYYRIAVPRTGPLDLLGRYPWLARHARRVESEAWAVTFTRTGVPISFVPVPPPEAVPRVTLMPPEPGPCRYLTGGKLKGPSGHCRLTESGREYLDLLMTGSEHVAAQAL